MKERRKTNNGTRVEAMNMQENIANLKTYKGACTDCHLHGNCLTSLLPRREAERLERLIERPHPMHCGQHLFRQGDSFQYLYVVKSGCLKNYVYARDGTEHIHGFYLPGELLGMDSIASGEYLSSAVALETTCVCKVSFNRLESLCELSPQLQHRIFCIAATEIANAHDWQLYLSQKPAEERFAIFLMNLFDRMGQRGFPGNELYLNMARQDIANCLGLACETVSRLFTRFCQEGILEVEKRFILIRDVDKLRLIAQAGELHQVQIH